jgi:hypothetical protein
MKIGRGVPDPISVASLLATSSHVFHQIELANEGPHGDERNKQKRMHPID